MPDRLPAIPLPGGGRPRSGAPGAVRAAPARIGPAAAHGILLASILALAAALYFYRLPGIPPGFFCDEASEGCDAYRLSKTLRDRHGFLLPAFLPAFGDWRGAAYAYLCVPPVKLLGLSEASVRGVAAVAGVLTVLFTYLLAREIAGGGAGLLSALFLAVSPWHFFFSRVAFHAAFPLFFVAALFLFVRGMNGRRPRANLCAAGAFFSLTLYAYFSARLFTPLFAAALIAIYRRRMLASRGAAALFCASLVVVAVPFARLLLFHRAEALARVSELRGIASPGPRRVAAAYLDAFSYRFLFREGDGWTRSVVRGYGVLPVYMLPLMAAGCAAAIRRRREADKALLAWLALAPLPTALVGNTAVARTIIAAPLCAILAGRGAGALLSAMRRWAAAPGARRRAARRALYACAVVGAAGYAFNSSLGYFLHYFIEYPLYSWGDYSGWFYGPEEAFAYARGVRASYDEVIWNLYGTFPNRPEIFPDFYMPDDPGCRIGKLVDYSPSRRQLFIVSAARLKGLAPRVYRTLKLIHAPDGTPVWAAIELTAYPFEKREEGKIIVDDEDPGFEVLSGNWPVASEDGCYGDLNHGSLKAQGPGEARWTAVVPADGDYEVFARWSECHSRATDTPYTIHHARGAKTVRVNQKTGGGRWNSLGVYTFSGGAPAVIGISNDANLWVIADAVKLEPVGGGPLTGTPTPPAASR